MKKFILVTVAVCLFLMRGIPAFAIVTADDITGQWTLTRTNELGRVIMQSLQIKDGKFTFRVSNAEKKPVLFAKGDFKLETYKTINVINFTKIEAGATEDDANPVDDERLCVYVADAESLTIALDFDKARGKSPRVEVYSRVKP